MTALTSTLAEIDATIARLEAHIAEYNRALTDIVPVNHLFHIPRDAETWPHLGGRTFTATSIRSDLAYCERSLSLAKRARLRLVRAEENAA